MRWLREQGVSASYDDYVGLPIPVLQDARLLMEAEAAHHKSEQRRAEQANRSVSRGKRR